MARKPTKRVPKYRRYLLPGAILIALLVIGSVVLALNNHSKPKVSGSQAGDTNKTSSSSNSSTYSATPLNPSVNSSNDSRKDNSSTAGTLSTPAAATSFNVTITRVDTVDNPMIVGSLVSGVTDGSCILSASRSGYADVTTTSTVVQQNNSYICQNLSLSKSQFPISGDWGLVLTVTSGGTTASSEPWPITL